MATEATPSTYRGMSKSSSNVPLTYNISPATSDSVCSRIVKFVSASVTNSVDVLYPARPVVPASPSYEANTSLKPTEALNGTNKVPVAVPFARVVTVTDTSSVMLVAGNENVTCCPSIGAPVLSSSKIRTSRKSPRSVRSFKDG